MWRGVTNLPSKGDIFNYLPRSTSYIHYKPSVFKLFALHTLELSRTTSDIDISVYNIDTFSQSLPCSCHIFDYDMDVFSEYHYHCMHVSTLTIFYCKRQSPASIEQFPHRIELSSIIVPMGEEVMPYPQPCHLNLRICL